MNDCTLLLPVAGRSSRFAGMRPKWLLTHPNGTFMLAEAIRGLQPAEFERIVIVALLAHEKDYEFRDKVVSEIGSTFEIPESRFTVVLLETETGSQPETVYQGIKHAGIEGKVLIKDSDNQFTLTADFSRNFVAVIDLASVGVIEAANKSYVRLDDREVVTKIVEKRVISNLFCCGGYFFAKAEEFAAYYELLKDEKGLYVSHVIGRMLEDGHEFGAQVGEGFEDWGTVNDWRRYKEKFATVFVNLDGIVVLDSSKHFEPMWGTTEALRRNVVTINELHDSGRVRIIITTARGESFREATEEQLRKLGVQYHSVIMGLPYGCQQILINDFSKDTVYAAATAINTRTNDDRLDEMLVGLRGERASPRLGGR